MKLDATTLIVGAAIVMAILYVGSHLQINQGGDTFITNNEIITQLESPPTYDARCSAFLTKNVVEFGEPVTGTITDGANTLCTVYGIMEGTDTWRQVAEGTTNSEGKLTFTDTLLVAGTFHFRVICGDCLTNEVTLTVKPDAPDTPCSDSDGKNKLTPGFTTKDGMYYYDDCAGNWAVTEYYCNGNFYTSQVIACDAGYICFETRGGDYCKPTDGSGDGSYTCGLSEWCHIGTCPTGYVCGEISSLDKSWCACITSLSGDGEVHPDWKPDGINYHPWG